MTIAIVDLATGQFLHTKQNGIPVRDSNGVLRPYTVDKAEGWYEFISASNQPPAGQKAQGTTFSVDHDNGTVTESFIYVDMTPEEIKNSINGPIDAQIEALERQVLLPRITRDMHKMVTLQAAAGLGITEAELLDENSPHYSPGYAKFRLFDDQLAALRAQRVS